MGFLSSLGFGNNSQQQTNNQPQSQGQDSNNNNNNNNNSNMQFQNQNKPNGANAPNPNPATLPVSNGDNQNPNKPSEPADPFDKYKGMFDNKTPGDAAPNYTLDEKMLGEAAGAQDFMKGINPELIQKATSGDISSLMQLMQEVSRNSYKSSLSHSGRLTESFVGAREGFNEKGFSKKVRGELTVNALTGTPNFKNPVVREQLTRIANDLQRQHPDAAPEEIAGMAKDYITELSKAINPASETDTSQGNRAKAPTDFADWFEKNESF